MTFQHTQLASGRWDRLTLVEQLANTGSEVERTISWKKRGNTNYSKKAFIRALELLDLTINDPKNIKRVKELTRLREVLVDYFMADNTYSSSDSLWQRYFHSFSWAARVCKT